MGVWKVYMAWDNGVFSTEYTVYVSSINGGESPSLCGPYKMRDGKDIFPTGVFPFKWITKMEKIA